MNTVLLQPLPFPEADRIVWMAESGPEIKDRWISYFEQDSDVYYLVFHGEPSELVLEAGGAGDEGGASVAEAFLATYGKARKLLRRGLEGGDPVLRLLRLRALDGQPCFASVGALPFTPDLAVLCTPADTIAPLVAPLGARDAASMVREIKSSPMLFGYRGSEVVDVGEIERLIADVGPGQIAYVNVALTVNMAGGQPVSSNDALGSSCPRSARPAVAATPTSVDSPLRTAATTSGSMK